jgi:hypothetical protein
VEHLTPEQRRIEEIYLGLRTSDGLAASQLDPGLVQRWVEAGWAAVVRPAAIPTVRLTPEGWLRLDALVAQAG